MGQVLGGVQRDRDQLVRVADGVLQHRTASVGPGADAEPVADFVHSTRLCAAPLIQDRSAFLARAVAVANRRSAAAVDSQA